MAAALRNEAMSPSSATRRAAVVGPMPSSVVRERSDLVVLERALDVGVELVRRRRRSTSEVLAGAADLDAVGGAVVAADGRLRSFDESLSRSPRRPYAGGRNRAWQGAFRASRGRPPRFGYSWRMAEASSLSRLCTYRVNSGKPRSTSRCSWRTRSPKSCMEAVAEAHQLPQFLGRAVRQAGGHRALLGRKPGDPERVDGIRLRPLQVLASEPPCTAAG